MRQLTLILALTLVLTLTLTPTLTPTLTLTLILTLILTRCVNAFTIENNFWCSATRSTTPNPSANPDPDH